MLEFAQQRPAVIGLAKSYIIALIVIVKGHHGRFKSCQATRDMMSVESGERSLTRDSIL
jgi:uncharacterized membrane protein